MELKLTKPIVFFDLETTGVTELKNFSPIFQLTGTFEKLKKSKNKKNILIYGAGDAGRRLLISLENNFPIK